MTAAYKANISWLTANLATGGDLSYDPDIADEQIKDILEQGITHIIDLRMEDEDSEIWAEHGVAYVNLGTDDRDGHHIPFSVFDEAVAFSEAAPADAKVLVHCHMGVNRGPSVAAAILMEAGMTAIEAFDLIREKRPQAAVYYLLDALDAHYNRKGVVLQAAARKAVESHWSASMKDEHIRHINRYISQQHASDQAVMLKGNSRPLSTKAR